MAVGVISKKVIVHTVGKDDTYTEAVVIYHDSGAVSVTSGKRPTKRVTYAHGRWVNVTEEGMREAPSITTEKRGY